MDPSKIILFGALVYVAILFGIGYYSSRKVEDNSRPGRSGHLHRGRGLLS